MDRIFIVIKTEGEYDYYQETPLRAFETWEQANFFMARESERIREHCGKLDQIDERFKNWLAQNPLPDLASADNQDYSDWCKRQTEEVNRLHQEFGYDRNVVGPFNKDTTNLVILELPFEPA